MSYTIHCTKKLLDRVKPPVRQTSTKTTTYLGNWYATALFWKPQVALLVNERTLLPVLMPLAPANQLALRFPGHLSSVEIQGKHCESPLQCKSGNALAMTTGHPLPLYLALN